MFIGTGCAPKTVGMGKFAASFISFFKGEKYRSKLLDNLAFGSFNKKIPNSKSASDWLSRNEKNVQAYTDDELCGFVFTCDGFYNLFSLFEYVSSDKWAENLNKKTPVLLLAGKDDPVGHYGKDIVRISQELTNAGVKNVTEKLFENDRHEILNETDKEDVFAYILDWIENVI